ncbi:LacI family transcriptional regulator [Haloactinopolyspora alba]|uniref:LacI family transcriptional regulator n=2 Tax=Haloactinopolyspora alba TaxID=648780 RepID=A0A2P8E504_9ACTN|nr:LacI family transcriptional regulator [Haloactinopolyspora alba]
MPRPVGLKHVADRAGVSIGTVSNVLNRPDHVAPDTMVRVRTAMDQLGYVPNELARQLKRGGGTTLGMVVLNLVNPFFAELAHACQVAAEAAGLTVILGSSDQESEREERYISLFERQRVEGMLLALQDVPTTRLQLLHQRGMPIVVLGRSGMESGDFCLTGLDGYRAGALAAQHLVESGHRRITFLGGPTNQVSDRWSGLESYCDKLGEVQVDRLNTLDQTILEGRRAGSEIAARPPSERPDAVFAANDQLAIGLQQSVLELGLRVPGDIAVMGCDDIAQAQTSSVPLTTIRQPVSAIAAEAIRLVRAEREPGHVHSTSLLAPELVVRHSTVQ